MHYCVAFDISNNRTRRRVVKWCKQAGLRRMQRSVFVGSVPRALLDELRQNAEAELAPADRLCIFPLDKNALSGAELLGDTLAQHLWIPADPIRYF